MVGEIGDTSPVGGVGGGGTILSGGGGGVSSYS